MEEPDVPQQEDGIDDVHMKNIVMEDSSYYMENLPEELLLEIFSYLDLEELVHTIQYVCPQWRDVSYDSCLWRHLAYCPGRLETDEQIINILKKAPKLQTFVICERPVHSSVLYSLMENCSNMKKLIFCRHQKLSLRLLKKLLHMCPNIEYLFIPNRVLNDVKLARVIGQFKKLKSLTGVVLIDPNTQVVLKPIADGCPLLQEIDLRNMVFTYSDLEYLLHKKGHQLQKLGVRMISIEGRCTLPLLTMCRALKSLNVDSYEIFEGGGDDDEVDFKSLTKLTTVTTLTLQYINTESIVSITKIFDKMAMSQLQELRLMLFENYEDKLAAIIVSNCPRLMRLYFVQCKNFSDDSLKYISSLHNLQYLYVDCPDITDIGILHLTDCKHLKYLALICCELLTEKSMLCMLDFVNLQVLNLDYCNIKGLPFHRIPTSLKHLRSLSIRCCLHKDREAVEQLQKEMPHLVISDGLNVSDMDQYEVSTRRPKPDVYLADAQFMVDQLQ